MTCLVYVVAPTRAIGLSFMEQCGVAVQDETTGELRVTTQAVISTNDLRDGPGCGWAVTYLTGGLVTDAFGNEQPERAVRTEYLVNIIFYGDAALALAEGGDQESEDLFVKYPGLLGLIQARTGATMDFVQTGTAPDGYESSQGVRIYDPTLIATPANMFC